MGAPGKAIPFTEFASVLANFNSIQEHEGRGGGYEETRPQDSEKVKLLQRTLDIWVKQRGIEAGVNWTGTGRQTYVFRVEQGAENRNKYLCDAKGNALDQKNTKARYYQRANNLSLIHRARLFLAFACCMPAFTSAQPCQSVQTRPSGGWVTGYVIPAAKHCLTVDLRQKKEFDIHAMRFLTYGGKALLSIFCSHGETCTRSPGAPMIDIDLQGHRLQAHVDNMVGVKDWVASERIFLHDGTVVVPGTREANVGVDLQSMTSAYQTYARLDCTKSNPDCGNGQVATVSKQAPPYEATRHVAQGINVRAGWLGVQMVGIGNTLRNSVIEVDSRHAIALFGFGSIIENNTIIVHGASKPAADEGALALWDGNGAVIRNNRFIFKGRAKQAPPAIRLIDSVDVKLEGNTFEGFSQVVAQTGKSSYSEKK